MIVLSLVTALELLLLASLGSFVAGFYMEVRRKKAKAGG